MLISRWIRSIKKNAELRKVAHQLYFTTVTQSRSPELFSDLEAPDTLDGRFDLVVLHVGLVLRRLRSCTEGGQKLSDALFSVMFDDLDQTIREMGVGDLRVGKKVKAMARAFYGRCVAYDTALDSNDQMALTNALCKNIYGLDGKENSMAKVMAKYVRDVSLNLETQSDKEIFGGKIIFPEVKHSIKG